MLKKIIWPFDIYRHESYLESVVITLVLYKNLGKSDLRKSTASYLSGPVIHEQQTIQLVNRVI